MRTQTLFAIGLFVAINTVSAYAADTFARNDVTFSNNEMVSASTLAATVAHNTLHFAVNDRVPYVGNNIDNEAFRNSIGINAIVQNTAPGANVQQSVNVQLNGMDLAEALETIDTLGEIPGLILPAVSD